MRSFLTRRSTRRSNTVPQVILHHVHYLDTALMRKRPLIALVLGALVLVFLLFLPAIAGLLTEWYWFTAVGFESVFLKSIRRNGASKSEAIESMNGFSNFIPI